MGNADRAAPAAAPRRTPAPFRRVLLVGFMGSGKSTVGAHLASRLGWPFLDFDEEIERRAGLSVAEIFRTRGEAAFRALESEVASELLRAEPAVLASGGGWAAREGRLEGLGPETLSVWLRVSASAALERAAGDPQARPLLQGSDAEARATRLVNERERYYQRARLHLDGENASPDALAETILRHLERTNPDVAGR